MTQNVLRLIQKKLSKLPQSEQKIGKIILKNPTDIIQMSAAELAKKADSSAAAVIRFTHSIGLKGFTELKLLLSAQSSHFQEIIHTDILPDEGIEQIKKKFYRNTTQVLEETNSILNNELIERTADWLADSPSIFVYGLGASHIVAMDIKQKFTRVGKQVFCSQDQHSMAASMAVAEEDSVYIGISNSGEKKEGLVLMELAQDLGLHTISLTKETDNSLSTLAEIALKTADTKEAEQRSAATTSLLSQLFAIDIIFYRFITKRYSENIDHLEQSRKAIAKLSRLYE